MHGNDLVFATFLIFTGAALLATAALYARQSLLVAYIALGALVGPWGLAYIEDLVAIRQIGHVGIIFLLFLLGINLHPNKLVKLLRETLVVTITSSLIFAATGYGLGIAFGFAPRAALVVAIAMMFSSTIIGLKLLPTTALHHRHAGEIMISVLLLQDLVAILALLLIQGLGEGTASWRDVALLLLALPLLAAIAMLLVRVLIGPLMRRFDKTQEYLFLLTIGWCLGIAQLGKVLGLSYEVGAFLAGVALAANPISTFIAESLKPLRDFFLVTFFFTLGAGFALPSLHTIALPAVVIGTAMIAIKPPVFRLLLVWNGETPRLAAEIGVRLGQISEFSLLIALIAFQGELIDGQASNLIQAATLFSFVVSSYWVMLRYPTPIAVSDRLRQN